MEIILKKDGLVEYYSDFLCPTTHDVYLDNLRSEIAWQQDHLVMFGKAITTKRKVAWYGDAPYEYRYSNSRKIALPWTPTLQQIISRLNDYTGEQFNSCLLNFYQNGNEGMGWHSDNEKMMAKNASIASISLGASRKFKFRHNSSHETQSLMLEPGSLLMMKGELQDFWKHSLPVSKRVIHPRINLTFRHFAH